MISDQDELLLFKIVPEKRYHKAKTLSSYLDS